MNIASILREIDAEIEKLHKVREILSELSSPTKPQTKRRKRNLHHAKPGTSALPRRALPKNGTTLGIQPELTEVSKNQIIEGGPKLVVLPPKATRTKRYRLRPIQPATKALSGAFPSRPVFVPKSAPATSVPIPPSAFDPDAMEAAMRRSLLDGHHATVFARI